MNKKHGKGELHHPDGTIYAENWSNGKLIQHHKKFDAKKLKQ